MEENTTISLMRKCIICSRKLRRRNGGGVSGDPSRKEGEEDNGQGEDLALEEVASEEKEVVKSTGFLRTFNGIWAILKNKERDGNRRDSGGEEGISLETVVMGGLGLKGGGPEAQPEFCKVCCDKVVAVENLMKAVRQQVREIKMLWEQSRRVNERVEDVENEIVEGQSDNCSADVEVKDENEEEPWQESAGFQDVIPTTTTDPVDTQVDRIEMECDEDLPSSLDNDGQDDDDDPMNENEEDEDDSNWVWDEDDPDYIKSEQDDDDSSDNDDEELSSEDEFDEEPLTLVENQNNLNSIPNDPLEIPSSTTKVNFKVTSSPNTTQSIRPQPGPSSVDLKGEVSCDVEGCSLKFSSASSLHRHKRNCHSKPIWEVGNTTRDTKSLAIAYASSSPNVFTCMLEGCTRSLPSSDALHRHKRTSHTKLMIELGKLDPKNKFICSCGRRFPTQRQRYRHQSRNKRTHPEFEFKLRETRNQLIGGQVCDFCGDPVKLTNILEHLAGHVGMEHVIKCPNFKECGHAFTHYKNIFDRHLTVKRSANCKIICEKEKFGFKCETCGYTTDQRIRLGTHVENEHERGTMEKKLKCPISGCEKMFAVKQSIFLHLHVHRKRRITRQNCDKCGEDVKIEEMEGHLKDKHGLKEIFGCEHCPLRFSGREEMVEHLWEHRDSGLSCDICGEGVDDDKRKVKYLKYGDFREHYFGEHQLCPKRYKCGECEGNKVYWRKHELYQHRSNFHNDKADEGPSSSLASSSSANKRNAKTHKCDICDNVSFVTAISLIAHKIRVHGDDPFKCDICGETFADKVKFSRHKKEHAGIVFQKEWRCEGEGGGGCGKIFKVKSKWKMHVEQCVHGGEKKYVCDECGKGYSFASSLKNHRESVHLGLKPWVCEECGEGFSSGQTLRRHKLIHTGERPFGCEICGQRFRQREVLKRHLVSHEKKGAGFKPIGPMKQIRKRKAQ